ncbi:hypothetical protein QQ045_019947 [Rhodiola kirilowii]
MVAGGNIVCKDKVHLTSLETWSVRSQIIPILVHMVNPELSQREVVDSLKGCGDMAGKTYAQGREGTVVQLGISVYLHTWGGRGEFRGVAPIYATLL